MVFCLSEKKSENLRSLISCGRMPERLLMTRRSIGTGGLADE